MYSPGVAGALGLIAALLATGCGPADEELAASPSDGGGAPVHIVFDQSLDQVTTPFDTAYEGASLMTALLRSHGATVTLNNQPLAVFLPGLPGPGHVLVLGIPWQRHYSPDDLAAVRAFLDSGGGVLVITEHDGIYGHTEIQNALIEPYGIRSLPENSPGRRDRRHPDGKIWPLVRIDEWGFDGVRLYMPAPLVVEEPARELVRVADPDRPRRAVVGAVNEALPGRLVVLADLEIFWNMSPTSGVMAGQNRAFLLKLFGYLAGRDGPLAPGAVPPKLDPAWSRGERLALFDASGDGWFPDGAPNGLATFAQRLNQAGFRIEVGGGPGTDYAQVDLLISIMPLDELPAAPEMQAARQLLLVSDGRSSLLKAEPRFVELFRSTLVGARYVYPLNALTSPHGFTFLPVTLLAIADGTMASHGEIAANGDRVPLYRSSGIAMTGHAEGNERVTARVVAGSEYYPSVNLTPVLYGEWNTKPRRRPLLIDEGDRKIPPRLAILVASPRVMGVADVEPLTDELLRTPAGEALMQQVLGWLDAPPAVAGGDS